MNTRKKTYTPPFAICIALIDDVIASSYIWGDNTSGGNEDDLPID